MDLFGDSFFFIRRRGPGVTSLPHGHQGWWFCSVPRDVINIRAVGLILTKTTKYWNVIEATRRTWSKLEGYFGIFLINIQMRRSRNGFGTVEEGKEGQKLGAEAAERNDVLES